MTPGRVLSGAAALSFLLCAGAILLLLGRPYAPLPDGAIALRVNALEITEQDLIEEPDKLEDYAAMRAFFARQDSLAAELAKPGAQVTYRIAPATASAADNAPILAQTPLRPRQLGDLPAPFWFQLAVGTLALMIGAWIFALRPRDWGARMFALTGLCVPVFAIAASVYSSRQIALPAEVFRSLAALNHLGAGTFGIALVGLFAMYPRPLCRPVWLWIPAVLYGGLIAVDIAHAAPVKVLDMVVMSQTLIALALAVVQWIRSRRQPVDRAGLRWLVMATLIGVSAFIGLSVVPEALGLRDTPLLPQGYAFGFFLIMHIGLALGLTRYRVFDLDRYAYLVWLWVGSAFMVILFDFAFLYLLQGQPWASLSLALLVVSFVYFPLRQLLLGRILSGGAVTLSDHIPDILRTALSPDAAARKTAWTDLLAKVWAPLVVTPSDSTLPVAELREQGLALVLPPSLDVGARELRFAAAGRRLFTAQDRSLADTLCGLADIIRESRAAFEKGVSTERDRISRDVHDNIGAQILSALHTVETGRKNELLRDTLADLRSIINEGFSGDFSLRDVLADLRSETVDRVVSHDITLEWETADLPDLRVTLSEANTLRSVLREALSNAIRHSDCTRVTIEADIRPGGLSMIIEDDGRGLAHAHKSTADGNGLSNMRSRLTALGGQIDIGPLPEHAPILDTDGATVLRARPGTRIALQMPLLKSAAVTP